MYFYRKIIHLITRDSQDDWHRITLVVLRCPKISRSIYYSGRTDFSSNILGFLTVISCQGEINCKILFFPAYSFPSPFFHLFSFFLSLCCYLFQPFSFVYFGFVCLYNATPGHPSRKNSHDTILPTAGEIRVFLPFQRVLV